MTLQLENLAPTGRIDFAQLYGDRALAHEWSLEEAFLEELITPRSPSAPPAGGINRGDRRALYYLVRALNPTRVLEIGTHLGYSTLHIAAALGRNRQAHGSSGRVVSVDINDVNAAAGPWREAQIDPPLELMRRIGAQNWSGFVTASSESYLAQTNEVYDFIFLDGSHDQAVVEREIALLHRAMAPGAFVLMHDVFPEGRPLWTDGKVITGPWAAVQRLRTQGWPLEIAPVGQLPWPTKLGSSVTSLAVLGRAERVGDGHHA